MRETISGEQRDIFDCLLFGFGAFFFFFEYMDLLILLFTVHKNKENKLQLVSFWVGIAYSILSWDCTEQKIHQFINERE